MKMYCQTCKREVKTLELHWAFNPRCHRKAYTAYMLETQPSPFTRTPVNDLPAHVTRYPMHTTANKEYVFA